MSDTRSFESRVEESRRVAKDVIKRENEIELHFLKTIRKLGLDGYPMTSSLVVRIAILETTMNLDLSDEKWND